MITQHMNKEKLDKLVDTILQEMGEIKESYGQDMYNQRQELISVKRFSDLILTKNVPLLEMLQTAMDQESFNYVINRVGNYVSGKYKYQEHVKFKKEFEDLYFFDFI